MRRRLLSNNSMGISPIDAPNGIYIYSTDGYLYNPNDWTSGETNAVGVALITDKCRFVIAPDTEHTIQWGGYGTSINGILTTTDSAIAKTDYNGQYNTTKIV